MLLSWQRKGSNLIAFKRKIGKVHNREIIPKNSREPNCQFERLNCQIELKFCEKQSFWLCTTYYEELKRACFSEIYQSLTSADTFQISLRL